MENNREPYEPWYYRAINFENMQSAAIESVWALSNSTLEMAQATLQVFDIIESLSMPRPAEATAGPACDVNFWPEVK